MDADASELRMFAAELGEIGPKVKREVKGVVSKGALNIKNTMQEDFKGSVHFRQVGPTINYDVEEADGGIEAEIGPNKQWRSARIANIAYFGGSRGGGGTVDVTNGLRKEAPNLAANLRRVMGDVL